MDSPSTRGFAAQHGTIVFAFIYTPFTGAHLIDLTLPDASNAAAGACTSYRFTPAAGPSLLLVSFARRFHLPGDSSQATGRTKGPSGFETPLSR